MGRGAAPAPNQTAAARAARAERRARACELSVAGWSYEKIYRESGLGYGSRQTVFRDVKAALLQKSREQDASAEIKRARELALLDEALVVAHRIMNAEHLAHSNGRLIKRELEDGTDVEVIDNGPNLAAADRLIKISESRRKLLGLDAPAKTEVTGDSTVTYKIEASPDELEQL